MADSSGGIIRPRRYFLGPGAREIGVRFVHGVEYSVNVFRVAGRTVTFPASRDRRLPDLLHRGNLAP
jgi:hypothetical protein